MLEGNDSVRVPCILCKEDRTQRVSRGATFLGFPIQVVICLNDGLVYLNPRWTKARYDQFYSTEYDQWCRPQASEQRARWEVAAAQQIWHRVRRHHFEEIESVLDIGAGEGWSLRFLKDQTCGDVDLAAIEASEVCARNITRSVGAELLARDLDADWHTSNQGRFDLVILNHVLEHTLDPTEVLRKVHDALSPRGVVYSAVPDMMSPRRALDTYWFRGTHTYYFSVGTLKCIAARAKLRPIVTSSRNSQVWALFTKAGPDWSAVWQSAYEEQMQAIQRYRRWGWLRQAMAFPYRALSRLLPLPVKSRFPSPWKESLRHRLLG